MMKAKLSSKLGNHRWNFFFNERHLQHSRYLSERNKIYRFNVSHVLFRVEIVSLLLVGFMLFCSGLATLLRFPNVTWTKTNFVE